MYSNEAFVALNVLFGIKSLPEIRLFWSKNPYLGVPAARKVMPRNRFEKIRQYLHLNNQENMLPREDPYFDKLFKIRPLLDTLSATFCEEYRLSKFVSIDKGVVKCKGRLGFKQYMPMKPVKREIKTDISVPCKFIQGRKMAAFLNGASDIVLLLTLQCSNLTVVHSSKTSKNCPKRVGFFATSPVDE